MGQRGTPITKTYGSCITAHAHYSYHRKLITVTQKQNVVRAYIMECLSDEEIEKAYSLNPGAVKRFSREIYGDGFRTLRRVNLNKKLAALGFIYWPYDYVEE